MTEATAETRFYAACILAVISGWVAYDCGRRGKPGLETLLWAAGVFGCLVFVLPVYLWIRSREVAESNQIGSNDRGYAEAGKVQPFAASKTPCRYCGHENESNAVYCPACSRQLQSSESIKR